MTNLIPLPQKEIEKCFENKDHQDDCFLSLLKKVFTNYNEIERVTGYPSVSHKTGLYLTEKFMRFDKSHHPHVVSGGLWLNMGFSVSVKVEDWVVDLSTCNIILKKKADETYS